MTDAPWLIPAVAVLIGTAIVWLIWAARLRWGATRHREAAPLVAEPDYLRREVSRLRSAEQRLARQLAEKEALVSTTVAASRVERDQIQSDLEGTRHQLNQLREQQAEAAGSGGAELRAAIARAAEGSDRAAADRARAQKQVAEAETAKALLATEVFDLKRRLAALTATVEQLRSERDTAVSERFRLEKELARRDGDARSRLVARQAEIADRDAEVGSLKAQVARNELLQRRVEDRELLLRSVAEERDQATAAHLAGQRDLAAALEHQRREAAARLAIEGTLAEREARIASLEAEIARVTKEREDRAGLATRTAGLIDTLRAEIRERDVRFQALLSDRRRVVEAGLTEIARLRDQLAPPGTHTERKVGNGKYQDDLKRIAGIGPALERLLHDQGVTSFRQIAFWTDDDIDRISSELGSFRDRIRRDDWVTQARREHETSYGEPLDR